MEIEQLKEEALNSVDKMVTQKAKAQAIAFLRDTLLPAVKQLSRRSSYEGRGLKYG